MTYLKSVPIIDEFRHFSILSYFSSCKRKSGTNLEPNNHVHNLYIERNKDVLLLGDGVYIFGLTNEQTEA